MDTILGQEPARILDPGCRAQVRTLNLVRAEGFGRKPFTVGNLATNRHLAAQRKHLRDLTLRADFRWLHGGPSLGVRKRSSACAAEEGTTARLSATTRAIAIHFWNVIDIRQSSCLILNREIAAPHPLETQRETKCE